MLCFTREDVAGVVLVDPMRCEEWPPLDPTKQTAIDRGTRLTGIRHPDCTVRTGPSRCHFLALPLRTSFQLSSQRCRRITAGHVLGRIKDEVGKMPQEVWPMVAAHWSRPSYYAGMCSHVVAVPDTVREMQSAHPIHGIPIMLLTPEKALTAGRRDLSQIGDNVQQVIAPASAHWIHLDQPELVIDSIREMVRAAAPEPVPVTGLRQAFFALDSFSMRAGRRSGTHQ